MTLFCIIYSKPHEKNVSTTSSNINHKTSDVDLDREKIIVELKAKILSRLNLEESPQIQSSFNWDNIPEEMKTLLNNEIEKEEGKLDYVEDKTEIIIAPLLLTTSCNNNQSLNAVCFTGSIPDLDMDEIISVKLIAPISGDIDTMFRNIVQYNIIMNKYQMIYDLTVSNKGKEKVEIDIREMFREVLINTQNKEESANVTLLFITFESLSNALPISHIIDVNKVVLEIHYKTPIVLNRSKRNTNMCQTDEYHCCTERLSVDIEELGWTNFIVAPRTFSINYCKGDCNNYLKFSSNHAKAMNMIRNRDLKDTRPCCVPYSYSNMTIMYQQSDKTLKITTLTNFIAASCGCL